MYRCVLVTKYGQTQLELTPTTAKKFLNPTHEFRWQAELGTSGLLLQKAAVTEEYHNRLTTDKPRRLQIVFWVFPRRLSIKSRRFGTLSSSLVEDGTYTVFRNVGF
jgi:hypothetical protein